MYIFNKKLQKLFLYSSYTAKKIAKNLHKEENLRN